MQPKQLIIGVIASLFLVSNANAQNKNYSIDKTFDIEKDILLVQFDCKTDVDDLHTLAAFYTLTAHPDYNTINYHCVAGTYGIQDGLYVPANPLFQLAFENNWTDAHANTATAVKKVQTIIESTLANHGDVWIAEAGQSDFTAKLIKAIQLEFTDISSTKHIHVIQHSNWNEKVTSPESLAFVKKNTNYQKIPDGNAVGNGTPGFRSPEFKIWKQMTSNTHVAEVWKLSIEIANKYNGQDGRYNNEAIAAGGLDFSDLSEVCWILGIQNIKDTEAFFKLYSN